MAYSVFIAFLQCSLVGIPILDRWTRDTAQLAPRNSRSKEFTHFDIIPFRRPTTRRPFRAQLAADSLVELHSDRSGAGALHLFLVGTGDLPRALPARGLRHHHGLPPAAHAPEFSNPQVRGIPVDCARFSRHARRAAALGGGPPHSSSAQRHGWRSS